ncbi:hypothetical protein NKG60_26440 [Mesorhizobium sp. M1428]|uniref:hypothetical protein n=1 Tax=unclassified Mesorhizobium TaxID=325217 RepID=UPI003334B713
MRVAYRKPVARRLGWRLRREHRGEHQFDAVTHFPDRRANIELDELAARLNDFDLFGQELPVRLNR